MPSCSANDCESGFARLTLAMVPGLMVLLGCSSGRNDRLVPVAGQVQQANQPLISGSVSLRPDRDKGNKSLDHPTGTIDSQGRYNLFTAGREGAPPGWYKVVVFSNEPVEIKGKAHPGMPKSLINVRYTQPEKTPLVVEVKADAPPGAYDFQLQK